MQDHRSLTQDDDPAFSSRISQETHLGQTDIVAIGNFIEQNLEMSLRRRFGHTDHPFGLASFHLPMFSTDLLCC
jgi:hypothetical protein